MNCSIFGVKIYTSEGLNNCCLYGDDDTFESLPTNKIIYTNKVIFVPLGENLANFPNFPTLRHNSNVNPVVALRLCQIGNIDHTSRHRDVDLLVHPWVVKYLHLNTSDKLQVKVLEYDEHLMDRPANSVELIYCCHMCSASWDDTYNAKFIHYHDKNRFISKWPDNMKIETIEKLVSLDFIGDILVNGTIIAVRVGDLIFTFCVSKRKFNDDSLNSDFVKIGLETRFKIVLKENIDEKISCNTNYCWQDQQNTSRWIKSYEFVKDIYNNLNELNLYDEVLHKLLYRVSIRMKKVLATGKYFDLPQMNSVLLNGNKGSGKSTFLCRLHYSLYDTDQSIIHCSLADITTNHIKSTLASNIPSVKDTVQNVDSKSLKQCLISLISFFVGNIDSDKLYQRLTSRKNLAILIDDVDLLLNESSELRNQLESIQNHRRKRFYHEVQKYLFRLLELMQQSANFDININIQVVCICDAKLYSRMEIFGDNRNEIDSSGTLSKSFALFEDKIFLPRPSKDEVLVLQTLVKDSISQEVCCDNKLNGVAINEILANRKISYINSPYCTKFSSVTNAFFNERRNVAIDLGKVLRETETCLRAEYGRKVNYYLDNNGFEPKNNVQDTVDRSMQFSWNKFAGYHSTVSKIKKILAPIHFALNINIDKKFMPNNLIQNCSLPTGVLFYGPSGCGKTYLASVIASELGIGFYRVKCSSLLSRYFGQTENNIRNVFRKAKLEAPSIIFFDDFDCLSTKRLAAGSNLDSSDSSLGNRALATFLNELDGISSSSSSTNSGSEVLSSYVLILVACKDISAVDDALLRPGRLHHKFMLDYPSSIDMEYLLQFFFTSTTGGGVPIDIKNIQMLMEKAKNCWTCADIKFTVEETFYRCISKLIESNGTENAFSDIHECFGEFYVNEAIKKLII